LNFMKTRPLFYHKLSVISRLSLLSLAFATANAAIISNGSLNINVRDDNGAIGSAVFNGVEYFASGAFISDWGMQVSTNTATFAINTANGAEGISTTVSTSPGFITATGLYTGGGSNIGITRTYALVSGTNVLQIASQMTNNGGGAVTLRYFDTFDPDQVDFTNSMDVYALSGVQVARATHSTGPTVILGSPTPFSALASGSPFNIGDGTALNNLFTAPFDGNGASFDQGIHGAMQFTLAPGGTFNTNYFLAFGNTLAQAESAFTSAITPIPEPSAALLGALGAVMLLRRRR